MNLSVVSLSGQELASLHAQGSWQLQDVLAALPAESEEPLLKRRRIWLGEEELREGRTLAELGASEGARLSLLAHARPRVLTASLDCTARIWCAETGACLLTLKGHEDAVKCAVASRDGRRVLTASWDGTARLWCGAKGRRLRSFRGHRGEVASAAFAQEESRVLTAALDGTVRLWCASTAACLRTFQVHGRAFLDPSGGTFLTVDGELFSSASGTRLRSFPGHGSLLCAAAWGEGLLLSAEEGGPLRLFCAETAATRLELSGSTAASALALGGARLAAGFLDGRLLLWSAETGEVLEEKEKLGPVHAVDFTPDKDGLLVAAGHSVLLWGDGGSLLRLEGHSDLVTSAAFVT